MASPDRELPRQNRLERPPIPLLVTFLVPLLQHWPLVIGTPLAVAILVAVISLVLPPTYTATTTFTAEVSSGSLLPNNLANLAGRFGLSGRTGTSQPDFFAAVLMSQGILRATLLTSFGDDRQQPPADRTLLDILNIKGADDSERIAKGVRRLRQRVRTTFSTRTDIVTLKVKGKTPRLSAEVANRMVELLDRFNIEQRQFQSREMRRFTGERLDQTKVELAITEERLQHFLESNRSYADSPVLVFEARRLQREVDLHQQVVLTLAQEFEQARIAEHRDVPALSIIDLARAPDKKSSPRIILNCVMAVVVSGVLTVLLIYLRVAWVTEARESPEVYSSLNKEWRSTTSGIRRFVRRRDPKPQV